jgi:hypothetical protein
LCSPISLQALSAVEQSYTRLNRLLRQDTETPTSELERDASRLVASWIESRKKPEVDAQRGEGGAVWYDFIVVTGERRYLLDQGECTARLQRNSIFRLSKRLNWLYRTIGYETLVHLMSVAPAVCWPTELQDGLARHLPLPFFRLRASEGEGECPVVSLSHQSVLSDRCRRQQKWCGLMGDLRIRHLDVRQTRIGSTATSHMPGMVLQRTRPSKGWST